MANPPRPVLMGIDALGSESLGRLGSVRLMPDQHELLSEVVVTRFKPHLFIAALIKPDHGGGVRWFSRVRKPGR